MMTPGDLKRLTEARDVLREWADRQVIVDECIPTENRVRGCFPCDMLFFFEIFDEDIAEQRALLAKAERI